MNLIHPMEQMTWQQFSWRIVKNGSNYLKRCLNYKVYYDFKKYHVIYLSLCLSDLLVEIILFAVGCPEVQNSWGQQVRRSFVIWKSEKIKDLRFGQWWRKKQLINHQTPYKVATYVDRLSWFSFSFFFNLILSVL
jgi:hypothetical protein